MSRRSGHIAQHPERNRRHDSLEEALGVSFVDPDLLRLSLAHSSYFNENPGAFSHSNERLEFLGDSVFGVAIAHELYSRHPDWTEGELTQARAALVRGDSLAELAEGLELGVHLYMGRGEEASGGRQRPANLAAALESLVGALLLDQGYEAANALVLRIFADDLGRVAERAAAKDPKSALQEAVQSKGSPAPSYEIVEVLGEDHAPSFTAQVTVSGRVVGRGNGSRKSLAEEAAAAEALKAMDL